MSNTYKTTVNFSYKTENAVDYENFLQITQRIWDEKTKEFNIQKQLIKVTKLNCKKIILAEFAVDEILPHTLDKKKYKKEFTVNGKNYQVRMSSKRFAVFKKSIKCASCGIIGSKMLLELAANDKNPHFNLYAVENGELVLMTADHIKAISKSGLNDLSNLQNLCRICNNLKGDDDISNENLEKLRKVYSNNTHLPRKEFAQLLKDTKKSYAQK